MAITVWGAGGAWADEPSPKEIYEQAAPATVHVLHETAEGSGFIYDADKGLIITNAHVIAGTDEDTLKVVIEDDQPVPADVVGSDPCQDLAVLKLASPQKDLEELEFGDSDDVETADTVMSLGYPQSEADPVTADVVPTNGTVQDPDVAAEPYANTPRFPATIQHSADVNPGNSGGPLLNAEGEVVGVNTLGAAGEIQGQFYAISGNHVKSKLPGLAAGDTKNDLGWDLYDLADPTIADAYEEPAAVEEALMSLQDQDVEGLYALFVSPNSPAQKAGLVAGDVITTINGTPVTSLEEICDVIRPVSGSERVTVEGVFSGVDESTGGKLGDPWEAELTLEGKS
jgi:S1-C subfamily serine protease